MKDLILLTDKPITQISCANLLKDSFKNLLVRSDLADYLYLKKAKTGFEIWFTPTDVLDDPEHLMGDTIEKCPNKKAYLTDLSYSSTTVAKKIVTLLKDKYGNMWIQSNEFDDWFGTADDFIKYYQ